MEWSVPPRSRGGSTRRRIDEPGHGTARPAAAGIDPCGQSAPSREERSPRRQPGCTVPQAFPDQATANHSLSSGTTSLPVMYSLCHPRHQSHAPRAPTHPLSSSPSAPPTPQSATSPDALPQLMSRSLLFNTSGDSAAVASKEASQAPPAGPLRPRHCP